MNSNPPNRYRWTKPPRFRDREAPGSNPRSFGADVTAVCSPRNVETARSLGAHRVIDYTREDFTKSGELHDVLIDIAGSRSLSECRPVLKPDATSCWWGPPPSSTRAR